MKFSSLGRPFGRRSLLSGGIGATLLLPRLARSQTTLPDKSMRMIVGSTASGGEDKMARAISPRLETRIGRHVHVEDKPSVAGTTCGEALLKGPTDGSVLAFIGSETLAGKFVLPDYPYNPIKDITPVTLAGATQTGLAVAAKVGVTTFADYLEWLKAGGPERWKIGHTACPAFAQVFTRLIEGKTGGKFQPVAYRGAAPMLDDMATGRLPACLTAVTSLLEHHRGPRLKVLLSSARQRSRLALDIPTANELGYPSLEVPEWFGIFVASAVPTMTIDEWNRHLVAVVNDSEVKAELVQLGLEVAPTTPQDAAAEVATYLQNWKKRLELVGVSSN